MKPQPPEEQVIDAALARLPQWQPPPGFAMRVAALSRTGQPDWVPALLLGLRITALVSVAAWLGAELLYTELLSMTAQEGPGLLAWGIGAAGLLFAWRCARPTTN